MTWQKVRRVRRLREFVPRADREAIIAAIGPVADRRAQIDGDHPLMLDCQIRNAPPGIEPVRRGKRRRRASIEAAAARPAMVGRGAIGFQIEAQIDLAEKQPGAEITRHQVGVLALPAEPGLLGERLLHHRSGVDKELQRTRPMLLNPARERFQAPLQGIVVIAASCVDRNHSAFGPIGERQRVDLGRITNAQHDYGSRFGPQRMRVAAPRGGSGEPAHIAVIATGDKLAEPGARLPFEMRLGEADGIEAGRERLITDRLANRIRHPAAQPRPR